MPGESYIREPSGLQKEAFLAKLGPMVAKGYRALGPAAGKAKDLAVRGFRHISDVKPGQAYAKTRTGAVGKAAWKTLMPGGALRTPHRVLLAGTGLNYAAKGVQDVGRTAEFIDQSARILEREGWDPKVVDQFRQYDDWQEVLGAGLRGNSATAWLAGGKKDEGTVGRLAEDIAGGGVRDAFKSALEGAANSPFLPHNYTAPLAAPLTKNLLAQAGKRVAPSKFKMSFDEIRSRLKGVIDGTPDAAREAFVSAKAKVPGLLAKVRGVAA